MGQESVGAGGQVALQWGGRALEQETELHCNGGWEYWKGRPTCIAMGQESVGAGDQVAL